MFHISVTHILNYCWVPGSFIVFGTKFNLSIPPQSCVFSAWINVSISDDSSRAAADLVYLTPQWRHLLLQSLKLLQVFISGSDLRRSASGPAQRRDPKSMTVSHLYTADSTFVTCGRCGSEGGLKTRLGAFLHADPRAAESNLFTL